MQGMSIDDFIISVFCLIDNELEKILKGKKLRQKGPEPGFRDSEVITIEIVGEFLGMGCDKTIWEYFKRHWSHFFPKMPDRSNFVRQAANLYVVKRLLQGSLATGLNAFHDTLHIIDGLPIPVCKFARAHFSQIFKGDVAYGYCASKQERYYGFREHIVINSIGVITEAAFTKANVDERDVCPELVEKIKGVLLGDKGYIRPELQEQLKEQGLNLETPLRGNMKDKRPKKFLKWMLGTRRLIETVIGQLTKRFQIEKVQARDLWHQFSRFWRKLLAHTVSIKISLSVKNEPLQFERLVCH
ncbi:MAG: IS982 family transposase [Chlamydiae bacterium]|nr:IS982 family transposase [Chlamydiota bacterium]